MNNNKHGTSNNLDNNNYNSIDAVEQVYPEDAINIIECVNNKSCQLDDTQFNTQQQAANDTLADASVYSMNSARIEKHDRSQERRASKSKLTDRRSSSRLCSDGEVQQDRRTENQAANVDSIRHSNSE